MKEKLSLQGLVEISEKKNIPINEVLHIYNKFTMRSYLAAESYEKEALDFIDHACVEKTKRYYRLFK